VTNLKELRAATSSQRKVHRDTPENCCNIFLSHFVHLNNREDFQRTLASFTNWSRNSALVNIWRNILPLYHHSELWNVFLC